MKCTQSEQQAERPVLKNGSTYKIARITTKLQTFALQGLQKKKEKGFQNIFEEIMAENFSNPKKKADIHTSQSTEIPNKMKPRRLTLRLIIKMAKIKDKKRILKAEEKPRFTHKRTCITLSADISPESLQIRKAWHNMFKVLKREKKKKSNCNLGYTT